MILLPIKNKSFPPKKITGNATNRQLANPPTPPARIAPTHYKTYMGAQCFAKSTKIRKK
jgi:hypothetical protein